MSRMNWTARTAIVRGAGAAACALLLNAGSAQAAVSIQGPNILVNGDFEASVAPNMGDNIGPVANDQANPPWVHFGPTAINVVKVDGPGGPPYPRGPQSDASNAAAGVQRRYIAMTLPNGAGVYQGFTATCTGQVRARASFSQRPWDASANNVGTPTGWLRIRKTAFANTNSGPIVAESYSFVTTPNVWVEVTATTNVTAGEHYSLELQPIKANLDQASVNYTNLQCIPVTLATGSAVLTPLILPPTPPPFGDTLSNGGFEANPPTTFGNHIGHPIAPWATAPANALRNVVRVDGPGPVPYIGGPDVDATFANAIRHYFAFANQSGGQIHQSFVARCSGPATVRGYFSSKRGGNGMPVSGNGGIALRSGEGIGGALLAQSTVANLAVGGWIQRALTATLVEGDVYTVAVTLDGALTFDEASVTYPVSCPAPAGGGVG